jgi:hypothetical protein
LYKDGPAVPKDFGFLVSANPVLKHWASVLGMNMN